MNYLKYMLIALPIIGLGSGSIQAMNSDRELYFEATDNNPELEYILPVLKNFFILNKLQHNACTTLTYKCVPKEETFNSNFTEFIYGLYQAGFDHGLAKSGESKQKLIQLNMNLARAKNVLEVENLRLRQDLMNSPIPAEQSPAEQSRDTLTKSTKKTHSRANSYALLKNIGCGIAGACVALTGAWLYNLYTR